MGATEPIPATDETVLEVQGLTKVFGSGETAVRAVDGIDLHVKRGEIVLIMGPSGSGKTTLLTMLGALARPTQGTVLIQGRDITAMKESDLPLVRRQLVGFVFQSFNLLEPLSAVENVEVVMNLAGRSGREARARAAQLLDALGMSDRLHFKSSDLSGGEKQRVSIARTLANDPQLILADEPTANLDSKHGHDVVALLRDIAKQQRRSVIIVSHDHRIREVADRVLWLEDGRFKDIGQLRRDPVCGMLVDELTEVRAEYGGRHYYVWAEGCRAEFEDEPGKFISTADLPPTFGRSRRSIGPRRPLKQ